MICVYIERVCASTSACVWMTDSTREHSGLKDIPVV